ncbi:MAG: amidase [Lysobacterales bacterium]
MDELIDDGRLRLATAFRQLHGLAAGRIASARLVAAYDAAITRENPALNAFLALDPSSATQAAASDRRRAGGAIGRLEGLAVAVKDNIDVAGLPTTAGLAGRRARHAEADATCVARLRGAGAVILGKTNLDEGVLGTFGANPHFGDVRNPLRHDLTAGGSSAGSAAAVAAGLCSFALGTDTLGSVRIPASHCGVCALRPTHGEVPVRGVVPAARRLDTVGILARSVEDLAIVLPVLAGHDPGDPRSRRRRTELAIPDWEPGHLRSAFVRDLAALGVADDMGDLFAGAIARIGCALGKRVEVDFDRDGASRARRAALLVMEAELAVEYAGDLVDHGHPVSDRLRGLLEYARRKSAVDYAAADRVLDAAVLRARRLFDEADVLVLPTVPYGPYPLSGGERAHDADLTAFASLAGCPAVSLPMGRLPDGMPAGLQLVGRPGSDLRLLDLAVVCGALLDASPGDTGGDRGAGGAANP